MSTQSLSDAYEKVRGPNPQARLKSETSQIPRANLLPNIYNRTLSNRRSSAASVLPFKFFPLLAALPIISHSTKLTIRLSLAPGRLWPLVIAASFLLLRC